MHDKINVSDTSELDVNEQQEIALEGGAREIVLTESVFQVIFHATKDGMLLADAQTKKFYLANAAMLDLLGYTQEEILQLSVFDIHPSEHMDKVLNAFHGLNNNLGINCGLPVKRKNGEIFYADISVKSLNIAGREFGIGVFRDVSHRSKFEEEALRERDFSNAVLNRLPGIFYMLDERGHFLRWNHNFEVVSGYSADELKVISPLDLFGGNDVTRIEEKIREVFKNGTATVEANLVSKNGTKTLYCFIGLLESIGGINCLVGTGIDISEQKQAQKMHLLGQLAGGVAHDFNNHLSAIMGFADMLMLYLDNAEHRHYAEMILCSALRSSELTRQLLAFACKGKYQSEPVNVHCIIKEISELLNHSIDKRICIKQDLSARSSTVIGDANQIQNAFLNLAINGRDAMPDGGELAFSTSQVFVGETSCQDVTRNSTRNLTLGVESGWYLKVSIKDAGVGISDDVIDHIFEPFFTTKEVGKGSGMGLAAVYGTVKNHKGAITVDSKLGSGTNFDIYLPLVSDTCVESEHIDHQVNQVLDKSTKVSAHILFIDDELLVRNSSAAMLEYIGCNVIACKEIDESLEYYRENWKDIDLVLLDLVMPKMNGAQVFEVIRSINPNAKVLIMSGYAIDGQAQLLLDAGAVGFLQKPFTRMQLTVKVVETLNS